MKECAVYRHQAGCSMKHEIGEVATDANKDPGKRHNSMTWMCKKCEYWSYGGWCVNCGGERKKVERL